MRTMIDNVIITNEKIAAINSIDNEIKLLKKQIADLVAAKKNLEWEIIENFPEDKSNIIIGSYKVVLRYNTKRTINEDYLRDTYPRFYNQVVSNKINLKDFDEQIKKEEFKELQEDKDLVNIEKSSSSLKIEEVTNEDF